MKTVLLVDDDDACRIPAAASLRAAGWFVHEAADGERGMQLAREVRPDAIVVDLMMPRVNGFQLCRAIRSEPTLNHTRILVLTGRDYSEDRATARQAGAEEYLLKPAGLDSIRDALTRLTSRNGDGSAPGGTVVKFWGVRGSIPTPGPETVRVGGNTSCVEVRADGEHIILDAGSGLRPLGRALATEAGESPLRITLLITHTHWDHIQGFPFFVPAYNPRNNIRVLGYEGARRDLQGTLAGQMESPYFPIALSQMPGNISIEELKDMRFRVGSVTVEACHVNHPGVCVGYRLNTAAGSIVYIPDHESGPTTDSNPGSVPHLLERNVVEFIRGADVLILDSQYTAEEYRSHVGWGHGCVDEVVRIAKTAGVKTLYLFHHDPSHDDDFVEAMLARARTLAGDSLNVELAREGAQAVLSAVAK